MAAPAGTGPTEAAACHAAELAQLGVGEDLEANWPPSAAAFTRGGVDRPVPGRPRRIPE